MRRLRLIRPGVLDLEETVPLRPQRGERVLVVEACGICRTDAKMWREGHRDLRYPRVLGHEVCARDPQSGSRYVIWPGRSCGKCSACTGGSENRCVEMSILGFHRDGGFAEEVLSPVESLLPVPDGLPSWIAALAEPVACCLNALHKVGLRAGETLRIFGAGPVGLLMALAACDQGARVVIREISAERLELCRRYFDLLSVVVEEEPAREASVDVAVAATGSAEAWSEAVKSVVPGGRVGFFSGLTGCKSVDVSVLNEIHYRELILVGSYGCTRSQMERALEILERNQDAARMVVGRVVSLEDVESVLAEVAEGRGLKPVVRPGGFAFSDH